MRLLLADLRERHGSVYGYATGHVGLDPSVVGALRARWWETRLKACCVVPGGRS
jgi:hypothetical protein